MKRTYRIYHTDFILLYIVGMLSKEEIKNIPKTTLQSWKQRDNQNRNVIGKEYALSDENLKLIKAFLENKTLLNAAKGLFFIYCTWVSIMKNVRGMKTQLRKNMKTIVQTIEQVEPLMGLKRACRLLKTSTNQFYAWKRKINCALSPVNECIRQKPLSVSVSELQAIKTFVQNEQYMDYPLSAIYYTMEREEKAFMSLSTFYKYAKLFDNIYNRKLFKAKQKTGIRAEKPKEIIHADVCIYRPLDYTKVFIYFIIDNYSRMILGWKTSLEYRSAVMLGNLRNVYFNYLLEKEYPVTDLIVDDGIENKGDVSLAIENQELKLNKLIAQKDIIFSNSMIEAVNKKIKYNFLYRHELLDFNHVERFLATAVEKYNNRPHSSLFGLTPYEVFNGATPDKDRFAVQKQQAKILRIAENKALVCDNCAFVIEKQA